MLALPNTVLPTKAFQSLANRKAALSIRQLRCQAIVGSRFFPFRTSPTLTVVLQLNTTRSSKSILKLGGTSMTWATSQAVKPAQQSRASFRPIKSIFFNFFWEVCRHSNVSASKMLLVKVPIIKLLHAGIRAAG